MKIPDVPLSTFDSIEPLPFFLFFLSLYIYRFQSILRTIIGAGLMETQRLVESNRDGGSTRSGLLICHDDVL